MSKILTTVCFMVFILPIIIVIPFIILGLYTDMRDIISTETSGENIGFAFIAMICFFFSFPMIIPKFRLIFKKLPWLYTYIILALLNILLMSVGILIINYGYEVKNTSRHFLFLVFMIVWMIIGRLSICLYCKFNPIKI